MLFRSEEIVEQAPAEEPVPAAADTPDYFKEFEEAVYQTQQDVEDAPAEDDESAPLFQF